MSTFTLSEEVDAGFKAADKYDAHRPTYPAEALEQFLSALNLTKAKGAKIVEVGAGTGKFTELIAAREESFEIVAVDPHKEMLEGLQGKVAKQSWQNVNVQDGDAEHLPIEDGWGDCAIAAQAFHWFATEAAIREIHRTLRPGAAFGAIWNIEDYNKPESWPSSTPWEQALNDIIWSLDDGLPRFRHLKWKDVFEKQLDTTPLQTLKDTFTNNFPSFSLPLGEGEVKWSVFLSSRVVSSVKDPSTLGDCPKNEEALWDRFATLSQVAVLKGDELTEVKRKFTAAANSKDAVRNADGELEIHGRTFFTWTSRV